VNLSDFVTVIMLEKTLVSSKVALMVSMLGKKLEI
jgi:hypothetical protein